MAAKPESKHKADDLIRDDCESMDWLTGCYCRQERTWLQEKGAILTVEHKRGGENIWAQGTIYR
jgi:hypothetical protein